MTIVTPTYNQAGFLEKTVRSVLLQGYPDLEYIICDGGSIDGSVEIIRKYEPWLAYWVSEKDGGQSEAINKGWRRASGEILSYLNSDDLFEPGAITAVAEAFLAHPEAVVVHGDWIYVNEEGREIGYGHGATCTFDRLLRHGQSKYTAQPSAFFRADKVRQVGMVDERLHFSMDYDLLLKLSRLGSMHYVPKPLARCRLHANAKTSSFTERHWRETLRVQARYNKLYVPKHFAYYLGYRLLRMLPIRLQERFRHLRSSSKDWVHLNDKNPQSPNAKGYNG